MTHWCMPACLPRSRTCDPLRPPLEDPALTLRRRLDSLHRPCALTVCPPASIPTPPPPPVAWVRARVGSEASWRAGASRIRQALSLHPPLSCRAAACEFFTAALTKRAWRFTERDKRYPRPRSPTHPYPRYPPHRTPHSAPSPSPNPWQLARGKQARKRGCCVGAMVWARYLVGGAAQFSIDSPWPVYRQATGQRRSCAVRCRVASVPCPRVCVCEM